MDGSDEKWLLTETDLQPSAIGGVDDGTDPLSPPDTELIYQVHQPYRKDFGSSPSAFPFPSAPRPALPCPASSSGFPPPPPTAAKLQSSELREVLTASISLYVLGR